ncbi:MAG: aminotransferase class I/II-fold pyridoxal phosphate-dependent enzyme [Desulfobacteraceae bacterium]
MKYYLDTSSVVKIYHPEEGSKESLELYRGGSALCISELSVLEFMSVVYGKLRENDIDSKTVDGLVLKFREDIETRYELLAFSPLVFEEASQVVEVYGKSHALRTLDSLQFAFFLLYCEKDDVFVCSDKRLTSVVAVDGHNVLFPTGLIGAGGYRKRKKGFKRIYLSSPHMGGGEIRYIKEAFDANWVAPLGPNVDGFEKDLQAFTGAGYAAALTSGTAALHLALIILGVEPGDVVICQSMTFSASANPITYVGATPVFVDSEADTWNMDPDLLEGAIKALLRKGRRIKAIIPVHLYGMPAKMGEIMAIASRYDIPVIEDAAESLGSTYQGKAMGTFGRMGVLSFNGNKIITTSGGGALIGDDPDRIEKARFLAAQARDDAPHYQHSHVGYNYRMSNIVAGIGRGQMEVLPSRVERRREINQWYRNLLAHVPGITFQSEPAADFYSNFWLTAITIDPAQAGVDREEVRLALEEENIEARPVWKPMHLQPVFDPQITQIDADYRGRKKYPCRMIGGGVAEDLFERGLCLPSGTNMTEVDMGRMEEALMEIFGRKG